MEEIEFREVMKKSLEHLDVLLTDKQIEKYYTYMNILIEENKKINLTAITEPRDIIVKHFIDSLTINQNIKENSYVLDVGTGAGFPGIPIKIYRDDVKLVLLDSLNKRVNFLNKVVDTIKLDKTECIHSRAEDFAKEEKNREKFDVVTSRAVASLNVLLEYMIPFLKIGGKCICMKGSNIEEELKNSKKALNILGAEIEKIENIELPFGEAQRNLIIIKKIKSTPHKYPRKAGIPTKMPII